MVYRFAALALAAVLTFTVPAVAKHGPRGGHGRGHGGGHAGAGRRQSPDPFAQRPLFGSATHGSNHAGGHRGHSGGKGGLVRPIRGQQSRGHGHHRSGRHGR